MLVHGDPPDKQLNKSRKSQDLFIGNAKFYSYIYIYMPATISKY